MLGWLYQFGWRIDGKVKFGNQNVDYLFCALRFLCNHFLFCNYHLFHFSRIFIEVSLWAVLGDTQINFRK